MRHKLSYVKIERRKTGRDGRGCRGCCEVASFCFDLRNNDMILGIQIFGETDKYDYRHTITSKCMLFLHVLL